MRVGVSCIERCLKEILLKIAQRMASQPRLLRKLVRLFMIVQRPCSAISMVKLRSGIGQGWSLWTNKWSRLQSFKLGRVSGTEMEDLVIHLNKTTLKD